MAATTWCIVYNGGDRSQIVDEEGHSVDPQAFACARRSVVRDLIDDQFLLVIDPQTITDDSTHAARMAKEEAQKRNDAIEAEKADDEKASTKKVTSAKSNNAKQS